VDILALGLQHQGDSVLVLPPTMLESEDLSPACCHRQVHPEWTVVYDTQLDLDPGLPEVRDYIVQVMVQL
jgi:hypothetical protein